MLLWCTCTLYISLYGIAFLAAVDAEGQVNDCQVEVLILTRGEPPHQVDFTICAKNGEFHNELTMH